MPSNSGSEPSDYIEILNLIYSIENLGNESRRMSEFEMLSIVIMIFAIIVTILAVYINYTKKVTAPPKERLLFCLTD